MAYTLSMDQFFPTYAKEKTMSNKIMWLELASTDIPASSKFLGDLFDWPIVRDEQMDYTMTGFERGETGMGWACC